MVTISIMCYLVNTYNSIFGLSLITYEFVLAVFEFLRLNLSLLNQPIVRYFKD